MGLGPLDDHPKLIFQLPDGSVQELEVLSVKLTTATGGAILWDADEDVSEQWAHDFQTISGEITLSPEGLWYLRAIAEEVDDDS